MLSDASGAAHRIQVIGIGDRVLSGCGGVPEKIL
jgi:hypothetical protein